jgi:hypothetical protein
MTKDHQRAAQGGVSCCELCNSRPLRVG